MRLLPRDRRVTVIGAGSSGLVAAIHLARAGLDVTVLEHAPHPGGASSSTTATLPGFIHDHCASFNPMTAASPAFRELDLDQEGLEWVRPDLIMAHPFDDGTAIELHRDLDATARSLERAAPGAGQAWRDFIKPLTPVSQQLVNSVIGPLRPSTAQIKLLTGLRGQTLPLARAMLSSAQALGGRIFDDSSRATAWLAGSAQHSGLSPQTAGSGAFALLLHLIAHEHGWPFPRGGQQRLIDALMRICEREGVDVRCGAHVQEIELRDDRVASVQLRGGEQLGTGAVLSSISLRPLLGMLPAGALPGRLERWRYGTAAFKLDYALSGPVPWTAPAAREASVVHVAGELTELTAAANAGADGRVPERPVLVIGQHSLTDPTRAPEGHQTLYCYAHVPARYDCPDDEIVGRIEAQLERFAPGFSDVVEARASRNPRETEAENPSLVDGDLAGGSMELDQQLIFRPDPWLCRYRTPLRGLYVCGASVHPGGSVHGMSGRGAARALISDRHLRPWRAS